MRLRARLAALAALAAITLAGCVRLDTVNTFYADDTFSQHLIFAISPEAAKQLSAQGGIDVAEMLSTITTDPALAAVEKKYPGQVTLVDYSDGELKGIELTVDRLPLAEFNATASKVSQGLGASATVERDGDTFVVTMSADGAADLAAMGITPSTISLVENAIDFRIVYAFPGLVTEANVGTVEGKTVTIALGDLASATKIRIVAGATSQIDWGPIIKWSLIVLGTIIIVGGATALVLQDVRRRRRTLLPPPVAGGSSSVGLIEPEVSPDEPTDRQ